MEENMKEKLERAFYLLKASSEAENREARRLKRKVNFLYDMTSLLFKYDFLEWKDTERICLEISKLIDACDKFITTSGKVKEFLNPLQPCGELIPEKMETLLQVSQELKEASQSFHAYLENPDTQTFLNSCDEKLKKMTEIDWN
jgi:hypothetical protein